MTQDGEQWWGTPCHPRPAKKRASRSAVRAPRREDLAVAQARRDQAVRQVVEVAVRVAVALLMAVDAA